MASESVHMHPAALLAVNHGAHMRGLHTHIPSLTPVIHFQLQSCSTRPLCQLIHTKTSIFYSYTHTHTHTYTHPVLHSRLKEEGAGLSAQKPEDQVQPNVKQAQSWVMS